MEISLVLSIFEMKVDLKKADCDIYNSKSDNKSFGKNNTKSRLFYKTQTIY